MPEEGMGGGGGQTKRTRRERGRGVGGLLAREEVICQIGFSLTAGTRRCPSSWQTDGDRFSPLRVCVCVCARTHTHTPTPLHERPVMCQRDSLCCVPNAIIDPAVHYPELLIVLRLVIFFLFFFLSSAFRGHKE